MEEECDCDPGAPAWMATFSDLATLLLTFFVLLLSFAEMDITEFKTMLGSIKEAFGVNSIAPGPHHAASTSPIELMDNPTSLRLPLNEREASLIRPIRRYISEEGMEEDVEVLTSDRGVVVRLRDRLLFDTGSDQVKQEGMELLDKIAELAGAFPDGLSVEGHTDDRPINTSRFPSNWELSTARATAVLRHMQRNQPLPVRQLQVVGYAETRPIAANDTSENRAMNRRVEFVFERPTPAAGEQDGDAAGEQDGDAAGEQEAAEGGADSAREAPGDEAPEGGTAEPVNADGEGTSNPEAG